jgi:hypothetical protein
MFVRFTDNCKLLYILYIYQAGNNLIIIGLRYRIACYNNLNSQYCTIIYIPMVSAIILSFSDTRAISYHNKQHFLE